MSTQSTTSEYLLLFRGTKWDQGLSPAEIQKVMSDWMAWFERLTQQGKVKSGRPLGDEGKIVSGKKGRMVTDGPFAESKEAVGGFFLLDVDGWDEAVEIARECPALSYGLTVEVRPVIQSCQIAQRAGLQLAHATA
ncbi:MAG TPA: YciI family protein [Chthoniobacterales bacterium]